MYLIYIFLWFTDWNYNWCPNAMYYQNGWLRYWACKWSRWSSRPIRCIRSIFFIKSWKCRLTSLRNRGTGMIASSSTFRPHPGRVIRDLSRQLHAACHGTEALVCSNQPREAAASSYLAIIFEGLSVVYPGTSAQLRCQCTSRISTGAGVGRGDLK